ncbi:MAG: hypothetical protein AB7E47_05945 [Desulfovibrionaceae bacterium]
MKYLKKDLPGKQIKLLVEFLDNLGKNPPHNATVTIIRRLRAKETMHGPIPLTSFGPEDAWWLKLEWTCPCCGLVPHCYIPEAWIEEGKVQFA